MTAKDPAPQQASKQFLVTFMATEGGNAAAPHLSTPPHPQRIKLCTSIHQAAQPFIRHFSIPRNVKGLQGGGMVSKHQQRGISDLHAATAIRGWCLNGQRRPMKEGGGCTYITALQHHMLQPQIPLANGCGAIGQSLEARQQLSFSHIGAQSSGQCCQWRGLQQHLQGEQ